MAAPDPVQTFLLEAGDLLAQIEEIALDLEQHPADVEAINRLFRAFHTLKGSGAMFGFDAVADFTHHVENALERVRGGELQVTRPLLTLILGARDQIQLLLDQPEHPAAADECRRIIGALAAIAGAGQPETVAQAAAPVGGTPVVATWRVHFRPAPGIAASGTDPLALLDELRRLGPCKVVADSGDVPALERLDPEQCHFAWDIELTTDRGRDAIRDVFIFVEDDSRIAIEPASAETRGNTATAASPEPAKGPAATRAVAAGSQGPAQRNAARDATVRVPSSKLDQLVNLVGELVMNQSRLVQVSAGIDNPLLAGPVEAIERLVGELRDTVLGVRMMPIGTTFSRFKRLVHDLSLELGKEIDLVAEGADTELDKTVLDQLGDPLVHLIRNCIDHGICRPDERTRTGKPRRGTIRLTAAHAGSHVVISIQDDGRGLDMAAIRAKAVEKGLIAADASLSEKELSNLVFLPGFSTAREVTSVSGRGVGMDVVKRQIDALRGGITLVSEPGVGTTISLTLPLTLAIIDGLLVELGGDQFIVPMSAVTENVELHRADRSRQNGRNVVVVRGELVPYIRLRECFGVGGADPEIEKVVITRHDDQRVGLVVDRVLGTHQTVIQALGRFYRDIEVCSGSTIMGDGRVALILDIAGLVRRAQRAEPPDIRAA